MRIVFRRYSHLLSHEKKTLTSRESDAETFTKIQFFRQSDQMQIHAAIDRIFRLHHQ